MNLSPIGACSMCPRPYVSIALCVNSSMCPGFYVANIMPYRPFVSRVLWVQGSLCPWFYVARDEQIDPLCHGTYVAKALCVQGSMCPRLYVSKALCGRSLNYIAKLSPSFSLSWTEMVYILTFPQPPTHPGKYQNGPI